MSVLNMVSSLKWKDDDVRADDDPRVEVTKVMLLETVTRVPPPMVNDVVPLGLLRCDVIDWGFRGIPLILDRQLGASSRQVPDSIDCLSI